MEEKKRLVPKPKNFEFPKQCIYKIRRNNPIFKKRSMKFFGFTEGGFKLIDETPIPDDHIICDSCNKYISSAIVNLIVNFDVEALKVGSVRIESALCQECIDEHYSCFPVVNKIRCITCNHEIENFKNKISEKEFLISGMCQECQDSVFEHIEGEDD